MPGTGALTGYKSVENCYLHSWRHSNFIKIVERQVLNYEFQEAPLGALIYLILI